MTGPVYRAEGFCPICMGPSVFSANDPWYRDHLFCEGCGSIPRERALATVLEELFPAWRDCAIHESSPLGRGMSLKMDRECARYTATQFLPAQPLGALVGEVRNENLECQTFAPESFDLVVSLDVMEHVNEPRACFMEVWRTLKPGGAYLFTAPTYKDRTQSIRRARYRPDGTVEHLAEPEYHANPVSDCGSLVTFHYGYDLPELIGEWSGLAARVTRFHDRWRGIIGDFTEVYVCEKKPGSTPRGGPPPLKPLQEQVAELQAQVTAMRASTSWRLTAPLRALATSLRR
jgi:SAM-dependent methyltransferase